MKRTLPLALAAGLLVATAGIGLAVAQNGGDATTAPDAHHRSFLAALDKNGDGVIDRQEWDAHFDELDTNHDGRLEADELPGPPHMMMENMPPEALAFFLGHLADANHDGKVTRQEWDAFIASHDTNHDGALSVDEVHAGHAEEMTKRFGGKLPPIAAHWDTDGDGKLSVAELDALFKAADKNGDGVLDQQDFPAWGQHGLHHQR